MTNDLQTASSDSYELSINGAPGIGAKESDAGDVRQVAQKIQPSNPASVSEFGRMSQNTPRATLIACSIRCAVTVTSGRSRAKLSQVVSIARALNMGPLSINDHAFQWLGP